MSKISDGGPAFPQSRVWNAERAEYEDTQQFPGMSLRDWFAAMAPKPARWQMKLEQGRDRARNPHNDYHKPKIRSESEIEADLRYEHADAMLAARGAS
jgi:hypothetical protein